MNLHLAAAVCTTLCLAGAARAATVTIHWSGLLGSIAQQNGSFDFGAAVGDRVSGSFSYDDGFVDTSPDPDFIRAFNVATASVAVIGGNTVAWFGVENINGDFGSLLRIDNSSEDPPVGSQFSTTVFDNDLNDFLKSDPHAPVPRPILVNGAEPGYAIAGATYEIGDAVPGLFGPDLSIGTLDLARFAKRFVNLGMGEIVGGTGGTGPNGFRGQVRLDHWSSAGPRPDPPAVPLPAAGWMALAAMAGLAGLGARRSRPRVT